MKALLALAVTALAAGAAHADCPYPAAPDNPPDGATSTKDEMLAGQKVLVAYNNAMTAYMDCVDKDTKEKIDKAGDQLKPEQKADMQRIANQKHNAAIDQLQSVADRFNEQVKVFKAKSAADKKP